MAAAAIWKITKIAISPQWFDRSLRNLGLAMVSQCTKYEVSRFTRYEAVNSGAKCRK